MRVTAILMSFCFAGSLLAQRATTKPKAKPKTNPVVQTPAPEPPQPEPPPPPPAPKPKPRVKLETSYGPIVLELEPEIAPKTVENFLRYVKEGHYAGTIFHRVISGFMIQGGGLQDDMTEKPTHESIKNEAPDTFKAGCKNTRGTVAMARTDDPHSAMAQFYINTADNASLDPKDATPGGFGYCVFGRVVSGMEAVDKIEAVRTVWKKGMQNVPEYPVRIKAVALLPEQ
jgi:cyclophilin family peptidyl-prolyl cis-trans isomerase